MDDFLTTQCAAKVDLLWLRILNPVKIINYDTCSQLAYLKLFIAFAQSKTLKLAKVDTRVGKINMLPSNQRDIFRLFVNVVVPNKTGTLKFFTLTESSTNEYIRR